MSITGVREKKNKRAVLYAFSPSRCSGGVIKVKEGLWVASARGDMAFEPPGGHWELGKADMLHRD